MLCRFHWIILLFRLLFWSWFFWVYIPWQTSGVGKECELSVSPRVAHNWLAKGVGSGWCVCAMCALEVVVIADTTSFSDTNYSFKLRPKFKSLAKDLIPNPESLTNGSKLVYNLFHNIYEKKNSTKRYFWIRRTFLRLKLKIFFCAKIKTKIHSIYSMNSWNEKQQIHN